MQPDREAWRAAGGDAARLDLYATMGTVAPFSNGEDRCIAAIHPSLPHVGAIGDWVGSRSVLEAAEAWLAAQGCRVARGPMELSAWFPHRVVVGPFDEPPFTTEPTERAEPWQRAGYAPCAYYASVLVEPESVIKPNLDAVAKLSTNGWRVTQLPLDPGEGRASASTFSEAIALLHRIASESWEEVVAAGAIRCGAEYPPVPLASLQAWYAPLRTQIDPRLVMVARAPDGKAAGLTLCLPDHAQPTRGWFVVQSLGVLPKYRHSGVGTWLLASTHQAARKAGYKAGVHATMWTGTRRDATGRFGGRVFRRYALMEKALT